MVRTVFRSMSGRVPISRLCPEEKMAGISSDSSDRRRPDGRMEFGSEGVNSITGELECSAHKSASVNNRVTSSRCEILEVEGGAGEEVAHLHTPVCKYTYTHRHFHLDAYWIFSLYGAAPQNWMGSSSADATMSQIIGLAVWMRILNSIWLCNR